MVGGSAGTIAGNSRRRGSNRYVIVSLYSPTVGGTFAEARKLRSRLRSRHSTNARGPASESAHAYRTTQAVPDALRLLHARTPDTAESAAASRKDQRR